MRKAGRKRFKRFKKRIPKGAFRNKRLLGFAQKALARRIADEPKSIHAGLAARKNRAAAQRAALLAALGLRK